ncbi:hypothetical protein ILYODFUR_027456 [Ilyodon furcidens]|uniref:Uncharacterized protein n=1 Tax=Ilyodon furcidens TaxID=33524 RepID=A0ABV0UVM6_9TELE
MEKRNSESEVLEGHPLSARFLGSHPLTTKGLDRPELEEGGQERGDAHSQKAMFPLYLRPSHPHLQPHGSSLSLPLSPLQPSDTPAQANYQGLCSCTASLAHTNTHKEPKTVHTMRSWLQHCIARESISF